MSERLAKMVEQLAAEIVASSDGAACRADKITEILDREILELRIAVSLRYAEICRERSA